MKQHGLLSLLSSKGDGLCLNSRKKMLCKASLFPLCKVTGRERDRFNQGQNGISDYAKIGSELGETLLNTGRE